MEDNKNISLEDLKRGMFLTGKIPEPIFKSLTYLPFMVFSTIDNVEIDYDLDFSNNDKSYFSYSLKTKHPEDKVDLDNKVNAVKTMAKKLLWEDLKVVVKIDGQEL